MGPVNIQGPGDCWANSAAGALESALAVKEKRKVGQKTVSIQYLVDCSTHGINNGQ